ncbi:MAG: helix-turn-helix domain-containing protein [Coriobacteriia bacterium]|nr:helix-turn-helix domain-containing protein [Coriobacteriia bacterium]
MTDEQNLYVHNRRALKRAFSEPHIAQRFGQILKRTRIKANLTRPESLSRALHDCCGVHHSPRSIYRYESGEHSPPLEFVVATSLIAPNIFSDLLTEVLSPGIIEEIKPFNVPVYYDGSGQLKLFKHN